jgi:hypothetical protein
MLEVMIQPVAVTAVRPVAKTAPPAIAAELDAIVQSVATTVEVLPT